jgi:hypothetical protein
MILALNAARIEQTVSETRRGSLETVAWPNREIRPTYWSGHVRHPGDERTVCRRRIPAWAEARSIDRFSLTCERCRTAWAIEPFA